jgi:glycosyltransferase involved in cell wall biosynthesis
MQKKKLDYLFLGPAKPFRGGIAETQNYLAEKISSKGFEVEVWTFTKLYPKLLFPGKSQFDKSEIEKNKIESKRVVHAYNFFKWKTVVQKINVIKPKIVLFRYWTPLISPCWCYIQSKLDKSIKTVGLIDNWEHHEPKIWDKKLNSYFGNSMDNIATFSEAVATQIKKTIEKKILTGFHPIPSKNKFKIPESIDHYKTESNLVLFFGLVRKYKGLETLINSMKYNNNFKLLIVGEFYDNKKKYLNLIEKLNLKERVNIVDKFVGNEEIINYFMISKAVILPYKSASQSGVISLSYLFEKPIVVSNFEGLTSYIKDDNSGVVFNNSSEDLANAIKIVLDKKNNYNYTRNIKKNKKKYSWNRFADELIKFTFNT